MADNTVLPSDQTTLSPFATESSPSVPKASKKRSWVWDHFKEVELSDPKAKRRSTCNYCNMTFACDSKLNGTGSLANHLSHHCTSDLNPFIKRDQNQPKGQTTLGFRPLKPGKTATELV